MTQTPKPEERAPYSVRSFHRLSHFVMRGASEVKWFSDEDDANSLRDEYNAIHAAAHAQGVLAGQQVERERGREGKDLDFGDYCWIEQYRYRSEGNEMYQYKVIGRLESNAYVTVPVRSGPGHFGDEELRHEDVVPVVACICCGVGETKVRKFRLSDIRLSAAFSTQQPTPER